MQRQEHNVEFRFENECGACKGTEALSWSRDLKKARNIKVIQTQSIGSFHECIEHNFVGFNNQTQIMVWTTEFDKKVHNVDENYKWKYKRIDL